MSRILFFVLSLFAFSACSNSGNNASDKDSADKSLNAAGENNYIMENNVKQEIKKPDIVKPAESDDTSVPALDTIVAYATDTTRKY